MSAVFLDKLNQKIWHKNFLNILNMNWLLL